MTVTLHVRDVLTDLATIAVTGLTVCDIDEIPDAADERRSYFIPSPSAPSFVTDFSITHVTYGQSTAAQDARYTLNYKLLYKPVGEGRGIKDVTPGLMNMAADIVEAIQNKVTVNGAVTWKARLGEAVLVTDPIGTTWDGWAISVEVLDFIQ